MRRNKILKKAFIYSLVSAIIAGNVTPAFAYTNSVAGVNETQNITESQDAECEVYAELGTSFLVTIPKKITLSGSTKKGNYTVDVEGDIAGTEVVKVVPDPSVTLSSKNLASVTATIEQDKTEWSYDQILADNKMTGNGAIDATGITAGSWNGTFNFNVALENLVDDTDKQIDLIEGETIDAGEVQLGAGQSGSVRITNNGEDITEIVTYSSDNENITVTAGVIDTSKASAGETATITVSYDDSANQTASIADLFVTKAKAASFNASFVVKVIGIEFDKESVELAAGESATVTAKLVPENTQGTISFKLYGLDMDQNGNEVTILTSEDTLPGNYILIAEINRYTELLNIRVKSADTSGGGSTEQPEQPEEHQHTWNSDYTVDEEAGCETEGSKSIHCSGCNETKDSTTIPATGHNYQNGTCTNCGQEEPKQVTYVTLRSTAGESGDNYESFMGSKSKNSNYVRDKILGVTFYDDSSYAEGHYLTDTNCWDVSDAQDGSIVAWMGSDTLNGYHVYIAPTQEGTKLQAPNNASYMFANFKDGTSSGKYVRGLENVDFSNTTVTDYFAYDSHLYSIELPSTLKVIGKSAFEGCSNYSDHGFSSITIPNSVTSIGDKAFYLCDNLKTITIPDSVTSIGKSAFYNTPWLTNQQSNSENGLVIVNNILVNGTKASGDIIIPDGVTSISGSAFSNCLDLTSITIPSSVIDIGSEAFYYCKGLKTATIENGVKYIDSKAFYNCSNLASVIIPDSVTNIGSNAFSSCTNLGNVIIPDSVTSIGSFAFSNVKSIQYHGTATGAPWGAEYINQIIEDDFIYSDAEKTSIKNYVGSGGDVVIPSNVTNIEKKAFYNCTSLNSVTIPESVTSIEDDAFYGCTGELILNCNITNGTSSYDNFYRTNFKNSAFTKLTIGEGVTSIGNYAFNECTNLTSVTIGNNVTDIGKYAFYGCTGLTSATIGNNVTDIGNYAFYGCTGLTSIEIPESVTSIGDDAFYGCTGLTSVTIGNNVTDIGNYAFYKCTGLTDVIIGNNVTNIGSYTFYGCTSLTNISIGNSVTNIGVSAFYNTPWLTNQQSNSENGLVIVSNVLIDGKGASGDIIIPDGVTSISGSAFSYRSITSVTIPDSVKDIGTEAFYSCSSLTSATIGEGVTNIGEGAFQKCTKLTSIEIPDNVTSIGTNAFNGCTSLTNISIGNSVTNIGGSAFYNTPWLTNQQSNSENGLVIVNNILIDGKTTSANVVIPSNVTSIINSAFKGNTNMTSVTIPESVTSIGTSAFYGCTGLTSIEIPDGVTSISGSAFNGCTSLTSIEIPESVTSIGSYAFYGCTGLTSITIGNNVTDIGNYAFYNCTGLADVIIGNGVTSIEKSAFNGCSNLTKATFKNTSGWYVGDSAGAKTTALSSSSLANTTTAATYLKTTYKYNYWTRE